MAAVPLTWYSGLGAPILIVAASPSIIPDANPDLNFNPKMVGKLKELCLDDNKKPFLVMNGQQFHLKTGDMLNGAIIGYFIPMLNNRGWVLKQADQTDILRVGGQRSPVTGNNHFLRFHDYNINHVLLAHFLPAPIKARLNISEEGRPLTNLYWGANHAIEVYCIYLNLITEHSYRRPSADEIRAPGGEPCAVTNPRFREYEAHFTLLRLLSAGVKQKADACKGTRQGRTSLAAAEFLCQLTDMFEAHRWGEIDWNASFLWNPCPLLPGGQ